MKLFLAYLLCTLFLLTPASLFADITAKSRKINLQLTDQEKTWLIEHPTIRVGMDSCDKKSLNLMSVKHR